MPLANQFDLIPFFEIRITHIDLSGSGEEILVANNQRVGVLFSNNSANSVFVLPDSGATTTRGLSLPADGSPLSILFKDYGPLPSRRWTADQTGIASEITIIETLYNPRRLSDSSRDKEQ